MYTYYPLRALLILALLAGAAFAASLLGPAPKAVVETTPVPTASPSPSPEATPTPTPTPEVSATPAPLLMEPIAEFKERITKKRFGTYVNPSNSPVSPERFTGFHTAVDVEYADVTTDVPVVAAAAGTVVRSTTIDGYGGVVIIEHMLAGAKRYTLYGHLRPASQPAVGTTVTAGQQIGLLGTAYSTETDNERRHLHFAVSTTSTLKGYVGSESELTPTWIDPLSFFP